MPSLTSLSLFLTISFSFLCIHQIDHYDEKLQEQNFTSITSDGVDFHWRMNLVAFMKAKSGSHHSLLVKDEVFIPPF